MKMNCLIACVDSKNGVYEKLTSGDSVYSLQIEESIEYNPETGIEGIQWYSISNFRDRAFCIELLKSPWDSTRYRLSRGINNDKISYICSYQDEGLFYFQKIQKANLVKNRSVFKLGDRTEKVSGDDYLVLNAYPDALYDDIHDVLYFRKLPVLTCIFPGIEQLYRVATQTEIDNFLRNPFVSLRNGFVGAKVGTMNRHRIAMFMEKYNSLNAEQRAQIFEYVNEYCPELEYNGETFQIGSDNELKNLLYGFGQRFYTTPVTRERVVATSISKLK